ncbi:MAG TPA: hypothetical protein VNO30_14250 [Kofleriaceae bacterium]|nr:hypothetical protein [Kofleriaceae bacterium]
MKTGNRWPARKTCLMVTLTCLTLAACGLEEESTVMEESTVTSSEGAAMEAERDSTLARIIHAWARLGTGNGLEQGHEHQRQLRGAADGSDTLSDSSRRGSATRE